MTEQCVNCVYWDHVNAKLYNQSGVIKLASNCSAKIPHSILWEIKSVMAFDEGAGCPVYEDKK